MSSANRLVRNNESLSQSQAIYTITDKEQPKAVGNRLELFKANTSASRPTANERTFDLFPNLIPLTTEIMLTSLEYATTLGAEMTGHSKISTPTICFYQLFVLYGFFLVNDCYVRPNPSNAAKSWLQSSSKTKLLGFIKRLPVPSWMLPIFEQLAASSSPVNGNVFIVPNAGSVRIETHYGRFFPVNFFAALHDIAATMPGNSRPDDVYQKVLFTEIFRCPVTVNDATTTFISIIADYLGYALTNERNTAEFFNSRILQAFDSVFNPVLFRDQQRRKTFAKLNLMPTEIETLAEFNIYDLLFNYNEQNDAELFVVLETVATALDSPAGFTKTIGQAIASRSGMNVFDHGYSEFLLPTWSSNLNAGPNKPSGPSSPSDFSMTLVSQRNRAQTLTFLSGSPPAPNSHTVTNAFLYNTHSSDGKTFDPEGKEKLAWPNEFSDPLLNAMKTNSTGNLAFYLLPNANSAPKIADFSDYLKFDPSRHVAPEYQILDVTNDAEETAWLIGLSGKIIETLEIDGSTIAHPDPTQSTAEQNHQQGESLVPIRYTVSALEFYPERTSRLPSPRERVDNVSDDRVICSTHLIDRTQVPVASLAQRVYGPSRPTGFPGLTNYGSVSWISMFQYFLGFRASDRLNHSSSSDSIPNMPLNRLYVFSPYMYTGYDDHKSSRFNATELRTYWVTNLRTHFGSDHLLVTATHPYKAHPLL